MNIQKHIRSLIEKQLISNGIPEEFPKEFAALTERDLIVTPCKNRVDFTNDKVFTIDSATCKDMDDAVEVHKTANGYQLTVHIADVASYIQPGSSLDTLAFERATSHYLPNLTIPMLPAILSNDLCSLNPLVRSNTLSVVMEIDHLGNVIQSKIVKGVICSRVKGVYSEINSILSREASAVLLEKYSEVLDELPAMVELYEILHTNTINRGADMENYEQPYISYSESDIKLTPVSRGLAERMIEEYMIIANEWIGLSSTTDNSKLKKYNADLQKVIDQTQDQIKALHSEATVLRDNYVKGLIEKIPHPAASSLNMDGRQIVHFDHPDVPETLIRQEKERLEKLVQNIEDRAKRIHAIPNADYTALRKEIRHILGTGKRERYMIFQDLHQFDVQRIQPLLGKLEDAEYDYDQLDTELSHELAAYHAVCSEYGMTPQRFPFCPQSVQDIRYATADILHRQGLGFNCAELMAHVRKILSGMGYAYLGDKEEDRKVFRQIYKIHDKTILHVIYDSSGRITMEVAIEDDEDRPASDREIQQIVSDQGVFCESFEQIFNNLNVDGTHMKKEMMCPCGEEFAQIIDTSGFTRVPEEEIVIDYSMYESPDVKYLQMR